MGKVPTGHLKFAPRHIFEQILEYAVIPTFDLIAWVEDRGVVMVRRRIPPYKDSWALPGLRMMKPEGIEDALIRIARQETGLLIDPTKRRFVGQYVGRFRTERGRQDLSTCYAVPVVGGHIQINQKHFSGYRFIRSPEEIPKRTGGMYKYFLSLYFHNF
jgi:ADP-ribose pyrophosphatase YjhB (NUDIX family)